MTINPVVPTPWTETPLKTSATLSKLAGCRVLLKLENLQPSGSFKSRGIGNLVRKAVIAAPPNTPLHFYASSGGNAGLACVTAATALGYPSTVVVPTLTKPMMMEKIKTAGEGQTNVMQIGKIWLEADRHLREEILAHDPNGIYVPPFDHPDIWEGAETLVQEIEEQLEGGLPDAIVACVGGGGLLTGICQGIAKSPIQQDNKTLVIAIETAGADSFHASVLAKENTTIPGITSIATSLGCTRVADEAFKWSQSQEVNVHSLVVSDKEAVEACLRFADDERIMVEPACGATLAAIYSGKLKEVLELKLNEDSQVVLVVCGGSNISLKMLEEYRHIFNIE
ncbi:uncharacterized protein IL334_001385 [Kwoniella shivajii]|uniref:L-serine ammonia-lyase n=1 Tax=Kwoniella shivajii TaxID=564305 RepID=A0ABZ1CSE4_9TREE|nr:hypothetical protein IL334_001385 [Kwoniella shivajii]